MDGGDQSATGSGEGAERLALVCADAAERQEPIKAALQQLGYTLHIAKDGAEAIDVMRKNPYEVVVLDEEFQGSSALDNPVLRAIAAMAMPVRRYILVALVGRELKTGDNVTAFAKSVNAVVNTNDLPQLAAILRRAVAENNEFYRVFRQVLHETGKR